VIDMSQNPFAWDGPAIGLMDLDAFFASVEQLDHPEWRGKPVIVGGDPDRRGVVSTASYEARVYGVHSAMPAIQAKRLCPDAIWTHGHFDRYRELSAKVMAIIADETPLGRIGKPEDVARTVLFLAEEDSAFITGQVIGVSGGLVV
jgi:DNA polymerase-4